MANNIGDLLVTISGDSKALAQTVDAAKRDVEGLRDSVDRHIGGIKAAFGTLAAGLAFGALKSEFMGVVDGLIKLKDVSEQTGASVEKLSALRAIAAETGTAFDVVSAAVQRVNTALRKATPDNAIGQVLKDLGLSISELQAMDPADALFQIAKGFDDYESSGNKARAMQILMGKGAGELINFLGDLGEKEKLVTRATAEQAEMADQLEKQMIALKKTYTGFTKAMAVEALPIILDISSTLMDTADSADVAGKKTDTLATFFKIMGSAALTAKYMLVAVGKEIGAIAAQVEAVSRGDFKSAFGNGGIGDMHTTQAEIDRKKYDDQMRRIWEGSGKDAGALAVGRNGTSGDKKRNWLRTSYANDDEDPNGKSSKSSKEKLSDEQRLYERALEDIRKQTVDLTADTDKLTAAERAFLNIKSDKSYDSMTAKQKEEIKTRFENLAASQTQLAMEKTVEQQVTEANKKLTAQKDELAAVTDKASAAERYYKDLLTNPKFLEVASADKKERIQELLTESTALQANIDKQRELIKLKEKITGFISETPGGKADQLKKLQDEFGTAWNEGMFKKEGDTSGEDAAKRYADAWEVARQKISGIKNTVIDLSTAVDSAARNMTDAFIQFAATGKLSFKDFAASILGDLAKMIIQQSIFNALKAGMNAMAGSGTGWVASLGKAFGGTVASANGNVFQNGSLQAFANGGIVGSPTYFPMRNGTGLMGEAGPEAIMPLTRINGKLGVVAQGGGGVNVGSINVTVQGGQTNEQTGYAVQEAIVRALARQEIANAGRIGGINNPVSIRGI